MRVISGSLRGRMFDSPNGHRTHPMSEKIRGALFAVLGDISGLTILDAFAGSGAVAFEALSRGAKNVVLIERDRVAYQSIQKNCQKLGVKQSTQLFNMTFSSWSHAFSNDKFDVIVCDPPFNEVSDDHLRAPTPHLKLHGIIVYSLPSDYSDLPKQLSLELVKEKLYGDAKLVFYRRIE